MNWFLISASVCMWSLPHLYLYLCFYLYFLTSLFSWFLAQKPKTKFASLTWLLSLNVEPNSLASQKSNSNPREQEPDWLDLSRDHSRSSCLWPGVKVTCPLSRVCGNSPCKVYGHVLKGREELGKKWLTGNYKNLWYKIHNLAEPGQCYLLLRHRLSKHENWWNNLLCYSKWNLSCIVTV